MGGLEQAEPPQIVDQRNCSSDDQVGSILRVCELTPTHYPCK